MTIKKAQQRQQEDSREAVKVKERDLDTTKPLDYIRGVAHNVGTFDRRD